jgi:hypothetical protein
MTWITPAVLLRNEKKLQKFMKCFSYTEVSKLFLYRLARWGYDESGDTLASVICILIG